MQIVRVIERFDDLIRSAKAVPLTDQVRLNRRAALEAVEAMRQSVPGEVRLAGSADVDGDVRELLGAVDRLDELIRAAKAVPLTAEVRVEREQAYDALDAIRMKVRDTLKPPTWGVAGPAGATVETPGLVDRLDDMIRSAPPVPLTKSQVRVSREEVYDILDRIRAKLPGELRPDPRSGIAQLLALIGRLDDLVHQAGSVPLLRDQVRVKRETFAELVAAIRAALNEELTRPAP